MSRISLKDLELIRHAADLGSLTRASQTLHISQSAASQRLARLHDRLGMSLLQRRAGVLELTPEGRRLYAAAIDIDAELQAATRDIQAMNKERETTLKVTTQCYTCYRWLPFVIQRLKHEYPDLAIDIVPEATDKPFDALHGKEIDIALVSNPVDRRGFKSTSLFDDELFAVVHVDHPLAAKTYLTPKMFSGQTLVLYTGARHAIEEEVLKPAKVSGYRITQVRITEAIIELARSGHGIAVIAGWALDDIAETAALVPIRIGKRGFKRTWCGVVSDDCSGEYTQAFFKAVMDVGACIRNEDWRGQLRREFS